MRLVVLTSTIGAEAILPQRIAALPEALLERCGVKDTEEPPGGDLAVLGCLFDQWYPPVESEEYQKTIILDVDAEGNDLGVAGTYGEVTLSGGANMIHAVSNLTKEPLGPADVFYDFGSGLGRLVLQVFLTTGVGRAGGVELGAGRHRAASAAGRASRRGPTIYAVGSGDGRLYAQALDTMTPPRPTSSGSEWTLVAEGKVEAIATQGNMIYAVREDKKVYKQVLSTAGLDTDLWQLTSLAAVEAIDIYGDAIYAVGTDRSIWKQPLGNMTATSPWIRSSRGAVVSIAIHGAADAMYGVGVDMAVYKQPLTNMTTETQWTPASKGSVERIAIYEDTIYGVAYDKRIWKQTLTSMSVDTEWVVASRDSVSDLAISQYGFHPQSDAENTRGGTSPLEFIWGHVLREIDGLEDASVLYLSSLFFDTALLMSLGWAMSATLRPGTLVFSQRDLPGCWPGMLHVQTIGLPTTWAETSNAKIYVVTAPPLVPQPAWLVSHAPAVDVLLEALGGSWGGSASASVSSKQWVDAGKRAWPGTDDAMLLRMYVAGATALGAVEILDDKILLPTLKALVYERMDGSPNRSAVQCAWRTLATVARVDDPDSRTKGKGAVSLQTIVLRLRDTSASDATGQTVVSMLAASLDEQVAMRVLPALCDTDARLDESDASGLRPIAHAARQGHVEVTRMLLSYRVATDSGKQGQQQPLHLAAMHGHHRVARLLLEHGASVHATDAGRRSPRQVAAFADTNMTELLTSSDGM